MKIGIIGAGNIGSALTRRFTAAGHQVFVANSRGPQTLTNPAAEPGANPVSVKEASHFGVGCCRPANDKRLFARAEGLRLSCHCHRLLPQSCRKIVEAS